MTLRANVVSTGLFVLFGSMLGCGLAPNLCSDEFYETTAPAPQVRLPQDESPHCTVAAEWWYYTGRLETQERAVFGVEAVIFHVPAPPLLPIGHLWIAHYSVLDASSGAFVYDEVRLLDFSPPPQGGFNLDTPLVRMRGGEGSDELHCVMGDGRFELNLTISDLRGPVLHGGSGYVPYGTDGYSFYYSRPRMRAEGTLADGDHVFHVTGEFWFDRQWGRDLKNPRQPWDWFSIRLHDGSDIMLFIFPADGEPVAMGTYIPAEGEPLSLTAGQFTVAPASFWVSPHTGIAYETSWEVQVPSLELGLNIDALHPDQELDARGTTLNVYWEGLCTVTGYRGTQPVTGDAYVEQANAGAAK